MLSLFICSRADSSPAANCQHRSRDSLKALPYGGVETLPFPGGSTEGGKKSGPTSPLEPVTS